MTSERDQAKNFARYVNWLRAVQMFASPNEYSALMRKENLRYEEPFGDMKYPECRFCGK